MKKLIHTLCVPMLLVGTVCAQDWLNAAPQGLTSGSRIRSVIEYNGDLIVGGDFDEIGGVPAEAIAKWDGSTWSQLGGPLTEHVYCMAVYNGELYVGGNINSVIGSGPVPTLVKLQGNTWVGVSMPGDLGVVEQLLVWNNDLYAVSNGWGLPSKVVKYDGSSWTQVGSDIAPVNSFDRVNCIEAFQNELYIGGEFFGLNGVADIVAKYDGSDWVSTGFPLPANVTANENLALDLEVHNGKLFVAGELIDFTGPTPNTYTSMASYDGTQWVGHSLDPNAVVEMDCLLSFGGELYCGGNFLYQDQGENTSGVVIYNPVDHNGFMNTNFYHAANPYVEVLDMAVVNGEVHAVGEFLSAGTMANSYCMAKFDGVIPTPSTSVREYGSAKPLRLFPNPTNSIVRMDLPKAGTVSIRTVQGALVLQENIQLVGRKNVDVSELSAGPYQVRFFSEETIRVGSFVKN